MTGRPAGFHAGGGDAGVDVEFRHAGAMFARAQAWPASVAAMQRRRTAISSASFCRRMWAMALTSVAAYEVAGTVVDLQTVPRRVDVAQRGELAGAVAGGLAIVPRNDHGFIDVGLL